jgi:hypothetical protein
LKEQIKRERTKFSVLIFLFSIFFVSSLFILNYALPPFQNPDEPMHFTAIMIDLKGEDRAQEVEKEVLAYMDRHNWWRLVGLGRPAELPSKLIEVSFLTHNYPLQDLRVLLNRLLFYHKSMAAWLDLMGGKEMSLKRAYYFLRLTSAFFAFVSLCPIFFVWRRIGPLLFPKYQFDELSGQNLSFSFFLTLPVLMTAFLPQFLILSLAVTPDAFCLFLGCIFFASAINLFLGSKKILNAVVLSFVALIGLFTDRSVFLFLLLVFLCLLMSLKIKNLKQSLMIFIGVAFLILSGLYVLIYFFPQLIENSFSLMATALKGGVEAIRQLFSFHAFARHFLLLLADSFLIRFGWMTFGVAKPVYLIWKFLILISAAGLIIFFGGIVKMAKGRSVLIKIVFLSLAALAIQIVAIYAYYGRLGSLPQGRYLFPLILPLILLLILGLNTFFSLIKRRFALAGLIIILILEFTLFNYVLWRNIIPVFHLTIQSPHPGI